MTDMTNNNSNVLIGNSDALDVIARSAWIRESGLRFARNDAGYETILLFIKSIFQ